MALTVLNEDVAKTNKEALDLFPGDPVQSISVNKLEEGEEWDWGDLATPEFMDSVDHASIPEQILSLKDGMVVMLLRNLAAQRGTATARGTSSRRLPRTTSVHARWTAAGRLSSLRSS